MLTLRAFVFPSMLAAFSASATIVATVPFHAAAWSGVSPAVERGESADSRSGGDESGVWSSVCGAHR